METDFDFGAEYHVYEEIGRGASGIVCRGEHKPSSHTVAVKFLHAQYREDTEVVQRFITERTTLTALASSHIIAVQDLIAEGGRLGIVMEYAPGPSLRTYLSERKTLAPRDALLIIKQTLMALTVAHQSGVIHRDIKPDNIILTTPERDRDPGVKVADFGIAKILGNSTSTTHMVGTPEYMAPELIRGQLPSPSIDLYAVGITLYELLAGRTPFGGLDTNPFAIANHHLYTAIAPIEGIDAELEKLLFALLTKDPSERIKAEDAVKLIDDLLPRVSDLPPLEPQVMATNLHPATILKAVTTDIVKIDKPPTTVDKKPSKIEDTTNLPPSLELASLETPAPNATILKPISDLVSPENDVPDEVQEESKRWWQIGKISSIVIAVIAVFVLVVVGVLAYIYWPQKMFTSSAPSQSLEAIVDDDALPSGLLVSRKAHVDPKDGTIRYEISYKSLKSPVSGDIFESVTDQEGKCITPTWDTTVPAKPHSPAITSIKAKCGWTLSLSKISSGQSLTAVAHIKPELLEINTAEDLRKWLAKQSETTKSTMNDTDATSTAYPLQRLQSMRINLPGMIKQGEVIPISITGVWPNGENTLTPIFTSPTTGEPTSILRNITGEDINNLRLSDRCSGAISITPNGREMTALHVASCSVGGKIGNYDLDEVPINITTNGS